MWRAMWRSGWSLFAAGLLACEAGREPPPLMELCGVSAPTLAQATAPDQVLTEPPLRVGERTLYTTRAPVAADEPGVVLYGPPTLHSVGACGASPRQIGALAAPSMRARWPEVALVCDPQREQIVAVDPLGLQGPRPLYSDCGLAWSAYGRVALGTRDAAGDTLFLHPDPPALGSGPSPRVELFGPVVMSSRSVQVLAEQVFALTPAGVVVSIDLRTGGTAVEQAGVRHFQVSEDGRYLLWQGLEVTSDPGDAVTRGPVVLYDRERGVGIGLGETSLEYSSRSLAWAGRELMVLTAGTYQQIYRLPDLSVINLPEGLVVDPLGPVDDQRWLLRGQWSLKTHVVDLSTGVTAPLFLASAVMIDRDEDAAWLIEMRPCCDEGAPQDEGPVWRVPLDGGPPLQLAERASRYFAHVGAQLVTVVDLDVGLRGELLRVDLETGGTQVVADRVFAGSLQADADSGIVSYSRSDGERSGVWQLRLPPSAR